MEAKNYINNNVFTMKPCIIKISSKNKNSILRFSFLIFKKLNFKIGSKILLKNHLKAKKKKKVFTILKSPHVNKKAQEQFEIRIFSQKIVIYNNYDNRFIYFLKHLKLKLFPDIRLKVKFFIDKTTSMNAQTFNLYNYKFQCQQSCYLNRSKIFKPIEGQKKFMQKRRYENSLTKDITKSAVYLNILNIYGELLLKK